MPLIPIPPINIPNNPIFEFGDDSAVKDKKVPLSKILSEGGFRGQALKDAMAVSLAESGGDPNAKNKTPCSAEGDHAIGLMQMCTVHAGSLGIPRDKAEAEKWLKNPYNNAKAAYRLWLRAGRTFAKDWVVWRTGAHRDKYGKDPLITVDKNTASESVADAAGAVVDAALGPLDEIASALLSPSTWFRVGKGALGFTLIVVGTGALVFVVANQTKAGQTVTKAAGQSVAGKAVKAVT